LGQTTELGHCSRRLEVPPKADTLFLNLSHTFHDEARSLLRKCIAETLKKANLENARMHEPLSTIEPYPPRRLVNTVNVRRDALRDVYVTFS
jgi:hypothetical protein